MTKLETVLLIEDDTITNYINSRLIQKLSIAENIEIKKTGREALNFLIQAFNKSMPCPELILLDIQMPEMDGLEFLNEFRKINFVNKHKVAVMLLTTYNHIRDYDKYINLDVNTFLLKPLSKDQLIPLIHKFFP